MARLQKADPLQGFRFHVEIVAGEDFLTFKSDDTSSPKGEAGFQSATLPEQTSEMAEYREGAMTYTRKFPGVPTMNNVTLMRGVYLKDTKFDAWIKRTAEGGEYRCDVAIYHWHRQDKPAEMPGDTSKARIYLLHEAFPSRAKPGADLDSTSSEVSLAELDIEFEWFEVTVPTA